MVCAHCAISNYVCEQSRIPISKLHNNLISRKINNKNVNEIFYIFEKFDNISRRIKDFTGLFPENVKNLLVNK